MTKNADERQKLSMIKFLLNDIEKSLELYLSDEYDTVENKNRMLDELLENLNSKHNYITQKLVSFRSNDF